MTPKRITIAIDGHSSTGKSTMAKMLAKRIGYAYVDTGAMYRAVTLFALRNGLIKRGKVDEAALKEHLKHGDIAITFRPTKEGKSAKRWSSNSKPWARTKAWLWTVAISAQWYFPTPR